MMEELLELAHEHIVIPVVLFMLNSVWPIIYHVGEWLLCAFLAIPLNLIEWLHAAVDVFSGVQMITAPTGGTTDLAGYFFGQTVVMRVFWGVTLIAAALCLGFSIVAVVRSMGDSSLNRPVGKVMGATAKAMLAFLMVPFLCFFAVNIAGQVLRQVGNLIDSAGTTGERVYVSSALFAAAVTEEAFSPGGIDNEEWVYNGDENAFELAKPGSKGFIWNFLSPILDEKMVEELSNVGDDEMGPALTTQQFYQKSLEFLDMYDQVEDAMDAFWVDLVKVMPDYQSVTDFSQELAKVLRAGNSSSTANAMRTIESFGPLEQLLGTYDFLYYILLRTSNFSGELADNIASVYDMDSAAAERFREICHTYETFSMYYTNVVPSALYEQMETEMKARYWEIMEAEADVRRFYEDPGNYKTDSEGNATERFTDEAQKAFEQLNQIQYDAQERYNLTWGKYGDMFVPAEVLSMLASVFLLEWEYESGEWLINAEKDRDALLAAGFAADYGEELLAELQENFLSRYEERKQALYALVNGKASESASAGSYPTTYLTGAPDRIVDIGVLTGLSFYDARQYIMTHKLFGLIDSDGVGDSELDLFELLIHNFNFYSMFSENYFPLIIACWFYLILLLMIFMIFIRRVFELIMLFVVSPFFVSAMPLDDGAKFKAWREQFISKVVAGFGSIITLKIFILFLPLIWDDSLNLHQGDVIDFLLKLLLMVGGIYAAYKSHTLISSIVSERGAASERESTAVVQGMMQSAKGVAMAPAGFAKMIATDRLRSHANTVVSMGEKKVAGKIAGAFRGGKRYTIVDSLPPGMVDMTDSPGSKQTAAASSNAEALSKFRIGAHRDAKSNWSAATPSRRVSSKVLIATHRVTRPTWSAATPSDPNASLKGQSGEHRAEPPTWSAATPSASNASLKGQSGAHRADTPTWSAATPSASNVSPEVQSGAHRADTPSAPGSDYSHWISATPGGPEPATRDPAVTIGSAAKTKSSIPRSAPPDEKNKF